MNTKSPTSEEEVPSFLGYCLCTSPSLRALHAPKYSAACSTKLFLKVPLSLHCTVGYTNADMRRTDSIQHVEPIAFEHWKVKRQIVATVDWPHAKWNGSYVRTDTNATDLWEIEQLTLWNSAFQRIPQLFGFGNGFKVATAKHRWYVA